MGSCEGGRNQFPYLNIPHEVYENVLFSGGNPEYVHKPEK
jgi:hypothetical protein